VDEFVVILGGRNCFPFDSYENASKQLEKTVHTIQKLMSTNSINSDDSILDVYQEEKISKPHHLQNGKSNVRERKGSFRSQVATFKSHENNNNRVDLWLPRKNCDEWERQFAELSSILVGKNAIIDSQRCQLQTERNANENMEKENENLKSEIGEWKQKYSALDQELRLIREMGNKQEYMGNKVKALNAELDNLRNSYNNKIEEMQNSLLIVQNDLKSLNQRHENLQSEYDKLVEECNQKNLQLEELQKQSKRLETELADHKQQFEEKSRCSQALEERLCKENIGLAEWSKKLEMENKQQQNSLDTINSETEHKISSLSNEFQTKLNTLESQYEEKCKESANLNGLIENLNRHLTKITVKYNELDEAYKDMRKNSDLYIRDNRRAGSPLM